MQKTLVDYIKTQLKAGYDLSYLRNSLIQYGYTPEAVDEAVKTVYGKKTIAFSKSTLAIIIAIVSIIGLSVGVFLFSSVSKTPELLDVKLDIITDEIEAGEELKFNVEIFNLGGKKAYDVELRYEIYDSTNKLTAVKSETVALQTKAATSSDIQIASRTSPGIYILNIKAIYNGQTATASSSFIVNQPVCVPDCEGKTCGEDGCGGICGECLEGYECLESVCTEIMVEQPEINKTESVQNLTQPQDNITEPEPTQNPIINDINLIKETAKTDFSTALQQCKDIEEELRDLCFAVISDSADNQQPCQYISDDNEKDQCYLNYVRDSLDTSACSEVTNQELRSDCETFKE